MNRVSPTCAASRPRYRLVLAALLSAGVIWPACAAQASSPPAQTRAYAIGAAPLAEVLNRFAASSGVILVFDASLLQGRQSKGLQGSFDLSTGFQTLLAGTGLEAVLGRSGGYMLRARPVPAPVPVRDEAAVAPRAIPDMPAISVRANYLATVDRLDRNMIEHMLTINGDLTSQLRLNPNIQYSESLLSSLTGGEIAPAEISIHGAKPYQNEILLDGVSIANDIDPGNKIGTENPDFIPGTAQALAIDSSILCEVEVRDSNVSAEYGRFTGGVISSKICSARKRFGGNVSVGYSSSDWSTLFVDPAQQRDFEESSTADYQPRFTKWTYKSTVEARPATDWGVLVSAVRRTSDIPLKRFSTANDATTESREVVQERRQDTLIVKADYSPATGPHKGELSVVYAPSDNTYFLENARDSDYTIRTGGINVGARLESRYDIARLTHQLSFSNNDQSRRSDANYYRSWRWSTDKNWGDAAFDGNATSKEGAYGDIDQRTRTVEYKLRSAFTPFTLGTSVHRVAAGVELRRQDATYERLKEQYQYLVLKDLPTRGAIASCSLAGGGFDTEACSATPSPKGVGQFFTNRTTYRAGSFSVDNTSSGAYLEDEITWRGVSLRAGLRADHDTLAGKTILAPRFKFGWQAAEPLFVDLGVNRYYGRNLFAYAMQERINTLKVVQTRSTTLAWGAGTVSKPLNRLDDLKSPYDDELTAGLTYDPEWLAGPVSLRVTQRDGKDQVVRLLQTRQTACNGNQCYVYSNNGGSKTLDFTLSWSNARAFKLANMAHRMWVAINKSDVESNYASYADTYGSALLNDNLINYDGRVIHYSERPADNYNRPWTLRMGLMSSMPSHNLTISNMLRIRGGYQQILRRGSVDYQGATIDNYALTPMPRSTALDTVVHWNPRIKGDRRLDVKLTVENLTNQKNKIAVSDLYATYERGRTFALEIGYAF